MASYTFNPRKHPPEGWLYREQFGGKWWNAPDPMLPFSFVVAQIQAARSNNGPKPTMADCAAALRRFTILRLGGDPDSAVAQMAEPRPAGCVGCGLKRR